MAHRLPVVQPTRCRTLDLLAKTLNEVGLITIEDPARYRPLERAVRVQE
ncbi:hypothetical protein MPER_03251 [Moniliophthora perniciosa FA553]|nr:hypothetical protein MPER_03251 [Moniliophthora perniciosa FA553]